MKRKIITLIDKYFEGETSAAEEQELRQYFQQENLPEETREYAPLFRYLHDEATALTVLRELDRQDKKPAAHTPVVRRAALPKRLYAVASAAAALLIAALLLYHQRQSVSPLAENCVWVDGQRITDPEIVRQYAETAFRNVQSENDIVDNQLKAFIEP